MYGLFSKIGICKDYSQKSIWINLYMFAWWSSYVTVIYNFGAQYFFDVTGKYQHCRERDDITLLRTDVTLLPIHTCMPWRYVTALHYMSVLTFMHWYYSVMVMVNRSTLVCDDIMLQCYITQLYLPSFKNLNFCVTQRFKFWNSTNFASDLHYWSNWYNKKV